MSNRAIIEKELTQGIVPIGTPKAYQYDTAYVESAKASVQKGLLEANTILAAIRNEYGYPFTASSADAMTDHTKIYVYTGTTTETLTQGNWYYWNGTVWTSGGVYNAIAFDTDKTLSVSDEAADAKATGELSKIYTDIVTTDASFGTGGNLTPNNRLNFDRIYLRKDSVIIFTDSNLAIYVRIYLTGSGSAIYSTGWLDGKQVITLPYDGYAYIQIASGGTHNAALDTTQKDYYMSQVIIKSNKIDSTLSVSGAPADAKITGESAFYKLPEMRNGSLLNTGNAYFVSMKAMSPINFDCEYLRVEYLDTTPADSFAFGLMAYGGTASDGMNTATAWNDSSVTKAQFNTSLPYVYKTEKYVLFKTSDLVGYTHFALQIGAKLNDVEVGLRDVTDRHCLRYANIGIMQLKEIREAQELHYENNARFIKRLNGTPLTLLHFSDIHGDSAALGRILADAKNLTVDGKICTGDIVANASGQIASWWDSSVMTCIGNHDSATYSAGVYDWTALSMADRDAYYM